MPRDHWSKDPDVNPPPLSLGFNWVMWIFAIVCLVGALSIGYTKFFGVAAEDARREVFTETKSYVHGKALRLSQLSTDYATADSTARIVLKAAILHEATTVDREDLPEHVQELLATFEQ